MRSTRRAGGRRHVIPSVEPVERRLLFAAGIPRPEHVVIVVEENRWYHEIIGYRGAPYINELAARGALLTNFRAITYPSQPNYIALFSGSTHGVDDNDKPDPIDAPSLGGELIDAGYDFAGYSESLPSVGYNGSRRGDYRRHHAPWTNFTDVPKTDHLPFSHFPDEDDYDELPDLSFVIPDMDNNMHPDAPIDDGDEWLEDNLDPYIDWAQRNNSLFILTFDEDDREHDNHIVTLFVGPMIKPGRYDTRYDHYDLLRTLEDMFDLPHLGRSADRHGGTPIREIWRGTTTPAGTRVVGRHLFFNNSEYDDDDRSADKRDDGAIAEEKEALLPGRRANAENVSSYTRGINGVMVDVARLPSGASVGAGDFVLRVGDGRGSWSAAPSPREVDTRRGDGEGGSDRITLTWNDGAIVNRWLQVTVRATSRTGLNRDDVFYFGNLVGEIGNNAGQATVGVTATDLALLRKHLDGEDDVEADGPDDPFDHTRDGEIDSDDIRAARTNLSRTLNLFTAPSVAATAILVAPAGPAAKRDG